MAAVRLPSQPVRRLPLLRAIVTRARRASLTESESGKKPATSGESTTMFLPSAYRAAYFPLPPRLKSYSCRISLSEPACFLMPFFIVPDCSGLCSHPIRRGAPSLRPGNRWNSVSVGPRNILPTRPHGRKPPLPLALPPSALPLPLSSPPVDPPAAVVYSSSLMSETRLPARELSGSS